MPYVWLGSSFQSTAHSTFPLVVTLSPWVCCMVCDVMPTRSQGRFSGQWLLWKNPVSDIGEQLTLFGLWLQPLQVNSDFVPVIIATNTPSKKDTHYPKFGDKIIEIRVWRWNEAHRCLLNISQSLGCFRGEERKRGGVNNHFASNRTQRRDFLLTNYLLHGNLTQMLLFYSVA